MFRFKTLFLICLIGAKFSIAYAETPPEEFILDNTKKEERLSRIRNFLDKLTPHIGVKTSVNDNIFRTTEDIEGDFITELSPGIKYGDRLSRKKTNLFFDAGVLLKQYSEHDEHNVENPYFDFLFSHGLGRLAASLEYKFIKGQDTFTDLSVTADENFVDYLEHYPKLSLDLDFNRFLWELGFSHRERAYEEGQFRTTQTYKEDIFNFAGSLKVFPKTYFFLEYDRRWIDYTKGGNVDRNHDEYWLGLRGDISSKIKGLVKFGYEEGHFPEEDKSSSAVNINLDYQVSRRLAYNLEIGRSIGTSYFSNDELNSTQSFALKCRYLPPFNKKLQLSAKVSFDFEEYDSGREDKTYDLVLASEYRLKKWLKIIGEYKFEQEDSDLTLAEYKSNIASLKLIMEF